MTETEIVAGIWPGIRALGAISGLASASFLIWDRATRYLPYARFLRTDGSNIPEENRVLLRIHNPSNRLMLARTVAPQDNRDLYLSADDETFMRSDVDGIMVIEPGGCLDVHVERQDGWETLPPSTRVRAIFKWKYVQPIILRRWRTKRLKIKKKDFDTVSPRP